MRVKTLIVLEYDFDKKDVAYVSERALGALRLSGQVDAVIFAPDIENMRFSSPITQVHYGCTQTNKPLASDAVVDALATIAKDYDVVCAAQTTWAKAALARVSVRLKRPMITGVSKIKSEGIFIRSLYAGNLNGEYSVNTPYLMTLRADAFEATEKNEHVKIEPFEFKAVEGACESVDYKPSKEDLPSLVNAQVVVAGGQSVGADFTPLKNLALDMQAAVGATRAAADLGYVPYDWQIGQSGHRISPKIYLGLGVSGAAQHICGIKQAGQIFVINKDPEAPIFKQADYGLVADMFEVLPDLKRKLKE